MEALIVGVADRLLTVLFLTGELRLTHTHTHTQIYIYAICIPTEYINAICTHTYTQYDSSGNLPQLHAQKGMNILSTKKNLIDKDVSY